MRFKARVADPYGWSKWFAWFPVYCHFDKCWVWLESVSRCWDNDMQRWNYEAD